MVTDFTLDGRASRLGSVPGAVSVLAVFGTVALTGALSGVSATGSVGTLTPSGGSSGTTLFAFERQPRVVSEFIVFGAAGTGSPASGGISRSRVVNNADHAMAYLKQSTARNVMALLVLASDGKTGATGLTLTITASKDGAAFASITPTVTERGNGWYNLALTTSHTDTLGDLSFHITSSGADPCDFKYTVVTELPGFLSPSGIDQIYDESSAGHTTTGTYGDKLRIHLEGVQKILISSGSTTTSIALNTSTGVDGAAPSSSDDVYNGRVLMFITGACAKQATTVTDYVGSTKTLTVVALTTAPSGGDQAILV